MEKPERDGYLLALFDQQKILNRSVAPLVISLILVSTVAMGVFAYFALQALDRVAAEGQAERTMVAFNVERQRLEDLNREYAVWNYAHQKLVDERDVKWADDNIGRYLTENYGVSLAIAFSGDLHPRLVFVDGELQTEDADLPQVDSIVAQLRELGVEASDLSGFLLVGDKPYVMSLGRFVEEKTERPRDDKSMLLLAKSLGNSYLSDVSTGYKLPGLHVIKDVDSHQPAVLLLRGLNGERVLALSWETDKPSAAVLTTLTLPGLAILSILLVITWIIVQRDAALRKRHLESLALVASKDFLTGISNRREFFYLAGRELTRARRENQPVCLLLLDLDHFKRINDQLGHKIGDRVLVELAQVVRNDLRDFDIFARWGGEEFIILLPRADINTGLDTAERLRVLVAQKGSKPLDIEYTVSIGAAEWDREESLGALVSRADKALYEAKTAGRNCTRSSKPSQSRHTA